MEVLFLEDSTSLYHMRDLLPLVLTRLPYDDLLIEGAPAQTSVALGHNGINKSYCLLEIYADKNWFLKDIKNHLNITKIKTERNDEGDLLLTLDYDFWETVEYGGYDENSDAFAELDVREQKIARLKKRIGSRFRYCRYKGRHLLNVTQGRLEITKGVYGMGVFHDPSELENMTFKPERQINLMRPSEHPNASVKKFLESEGAIYSSIIPDVSFSEWFESLNSVRRVEAQLYQDGDIRKGNTISEAFFVGNAEFEENIETIKERLSEVTGGSIFEREMPFLFSQHRLNKGRGTVLAVRRFNEGFPLVQEDEKFEKLTLHFPEFTYDAQKTRSYTKSDFNAFFSSGYRPDDILCGFYGTLKDGTVTLSPAGKGRIHVSLDLIFEEFGVHERLGYEDPNTYQIKREFTAGYRDFEDLSEWDGKLDRGDYISKEYVYTHYDPENDDDD